MTKLGADDFPAFFVALHGHQPFPWQTRLAKQVIETGSWPSLLDLPTGAGKTATIDIAVFHLACEAGEEFQRRAPMRILFVIDRRIVVDAAFDRARKIAKALVSARDGLVKTVADRLRRLSGEIQPLAVVRLRGGVPQERDWARSPVQPLVAISTVDQAGSRLLFRGYGVSPRMRPVHAGLLGADALWLLDEVHLSKPFEQTLDAIVEGHGDNGGFLAEYPRLSPFGVVKLSATPGNKVDRTFGLDPEDHGHPQQEELEKRLAARKITSVETLEGDTVSAFVRHAQRLSGLLSSEPEYSGRRQTRRTEKDQDAAPAKRVAVVVNRVGLARAIFSRLQAEVGERGIVVLLTGRVRPLDRDKLTSESAFRDLQADPRRPDPEKPILVVATQTIEAGADIDVDALVTEIAPLDCLRQRFGRLDRLGRLSRSDAVILVPGRQARQDWRSIEAIYGDAAKATASWLQSLKGELDLGVNAFSRRLDELDTEKVTTLLAPRARAPTLLPAYADLWSITYPAPIATPDPALFLHGPGVTPDVTVVWRAGISTQNDQAASRILDLCPPSSLEAMSLPVWAVRRWLTQAANAMAIADVAEPITDDGAEAEGNRVALRRHDDRWISADAASVEAGDIVVVSCEDGGCDEFGWNPASLAVVQDLGTEAHYRQRRKGVLRISKETLGNALLAESASAIWRQIETFIVNMDEDADPDAVCSMLAGIAGLPPVWLRILGGMARRTPRLVWLNDDDHAAGFILFAVRKLDAGLLADADEEGSLGEEQVTGDSADSLASSAIGVRVGLLDHLNHVEVKARDFAKRAGFGEKTCNVVALAARLHDLGKADPRFQMDLRGMGALAGRDPVLAALLLEGQDSLLAKSDHSLASRRGSRAVPRNFRHEALSVALAAKLQRFTSLPEEDQELVLWLIGTHHGYGRPFFPACDDPAPQTESSVTIDGQTLTACAGDAPLRLDQGWFERAEVLRRRFGPWELARLEAVVRLADHVASAEERGEMEEARSPEPLVEAAP